MSSERRRILVFLLNSQQCLAQYTRIQSRSVPLSVFYSGMSSAVLQQSPQETYQASSFTFNMCTNTE